MSGGWQRRLRVATAAAVGAVLVVVVAPAMGAQQPTWESLTYRTASGEAIAAVRLPARYRPGGPPLPVAFYLHDAVDGSATPRDEVAALGIDALAPDVVLVAVDAGAASWCPDCAWVDGIGAGTVAAERHVVEDLLPAIEGAFNVRTDRGGRALLGVGMGGTGAMAMGLRHPDRFGFVAGINAVLDTASADTPGETATRLVRQGYPADPTHALRRNVSPAWLAQTQSNSGQEVLTVVGAGTPEAAIAARVSPVWSQLGFAHTVGVAADRTPSRVFADFVADRIGWATAASRSAPWQFSYQTTDREFGVWGWRFTVERPNAEFLRVLGARTDGSALTLSGSGTVTLTTPPVYQPGQSHTVLATRDPDGDDELATGENIPPFRPVERTVVADVAGRLTFPVTLEPTRLTDEPVVKAYRDPAFELHHTRVQILPAGTEHNQAAASGQPSRPLYTDPALLGTEFADWNVTVDVAPAWSNPNNDPRVLWIEYDSPVLGLRSVTVAYVPDAQRFSADRIPTLYYLHGTNGYTSRTEMPFHDDLAERPYLVVVPDADLPETGSAWCRHCYWVDAREHTDHPLDRNIPGWEDNYVAGQNTRAFGDKLPRQAETHVTEELPRLIEALFHVGARRQSRAIVGQSMGAVGALNVGFRNPDRYVLAGGLSGWLDNHDYDSAGGAVSEQWSTYLGGQGYPHRHYVPVLYRQVSPLHTAPQVLSSNMGVIVSIGNGCVGVHTNYTGHSGPPYCWHPVQSVDNLLEAWAYQNQEMVEERMDTVGLPWVHATFPGQHHSPNPEVLRTYYFPLIEQAFAAPPPDPEVFAYKALDEQFGIFGWSIDVRRPNGDLEFLNVLGARTDGRDITLAGTGDGRVTTPASFSPNRRYLVRVTRDGRIAETREVLASDDGRLTIEITLGPGRTDQEQLEAVEAGLWPLPHTRLEIADAR